MIISSTRAPMFPEDREWLLQMNYPRLRRDAPRSEPVHYDLPDPTATPLGAGRLGEMKLGG
jgi:hypothetical protein